MPLERADMMHPGDGTPEELGQNKPVLLRARVPESHTVYEIVARMEMVGGVFSRTMVRWLLLTAEIGRSRRVSTPWYHDCPNMFLIQVLALRHVINETNCMRAVVCTGNLAGAPLHGDQSHGRVAAAGAACI